MRTRALGGGAPDIGAVGFGAMRLSIEGRPDEAQALRVIHAALDAGVTLIDTADVYALDGGEIGHSERLIAKALRTWSGDRDRVIVASKGGSTRPEPGRFKPDGRPEHLRAACDASLAALEVDHLDLYQLHAPDPTVPFEDSVGALAELRAAGKIRWVGLSNVSVRQFDRACEIVPILTVQLLLSVQFRGVVKRRRLFRRSILAHCQRRGVTLLAHSPLGGMRRGPALGDHAVLRSVAQAHDSSPHAVALAWVLAQGEAVIPIPSARSVDHALDSVRAAELQLSREELAALDAAQFSTR